MEILPELGNQYVGVASAVSATFFEEIADLQGVKAPAAQTLDTLGDRTWKALAGVAGRTLMEQSSNALFFDLLSGGLTRRLTEAAADTIVGNGELVGMTTFQRVPQAGCCAFCAMLGTRGAVYDSAESAQYVGGRGMDTARNFTGRYRADGTRIMRSGGQAKGVRPRGSRKIGEAFHDHCRCRIVPLTQENEVELSAAQREHEALYQAAQREVSDTLTLEHVGKRPGHASKYRWVDPNGVGVSEKDKTRLILNHMRRNMPAP